MYTTKSIAHNTMLVYDPEEDKRNGILDDYTGKWYVDWV